MCDANGHYHPERSRLGSFFSNWKTYDVPAHVKLYFAVRNNWTKLRTLSDCCDK